VRMEGWRRAEWFDETGLPWVDPSPNMRSLEAALLYPAIGQLEYSKNYSVGRGTESPFQLIGAEFIKGSQLSDELNRKAIPGFRCYPLIFTPNASMLANKKVEGLRLEVLNRDLFDAGRLGVELMLSLQKLYPGKIDFAVNRKLIGDSVLMQEVTTGQPAVRILARQDEALKRFKALRAKYLIYR